MNKGKELKVKIGEEEYIILDQIEFSQPGYYKLFKCKNMAGKHFLIKAMNIPESDEAALIYLKSESKLLVF